MLYSASGTRKVLIKLVGRVRKVFLKSKYAFGDKTLVMIAVEQHLFPFRTEKLRLPAPKILNRKFGKIGRRRGFVCSRAFYL